MDEKLITNTHKKVEGVNWRPIKASVVSWTYNTPPMICMRGPIDVYVQSSNFDKKELYIFAAQVIVPTMGWLRIGWFLEKLFSE